MLSDDDEVLDPFVNTLVLGDGVDVPPFPDVLSGLPPPPFTALTVLTVLTVLIVFGSFVFFGVFGSYISGFLFKEFGVLAPFFLFLI